jgi:hypothetical protein
MNTHCTCEKDILALRLFEGNWRTGTSMLQHDVTCVGSCIVTAIDLIELYWIAAINKYFNMGCVTFRSPCTRQHILEAKSVFRWGVHIRDDYVCTEHCSPTTHAELLRSASPGEPTSSLTVSVPGHPWELREIVKCFSLLVWYHLTRICIINNFIWKYFEFCGCKDRRLSFLVDHLSSWYTFFIIRYC